MSKTKAILLGVLSSMLLMSFSSSAVKWDFLGQRKVNFIADKDEIMVTAREGVFKKIKLKVSNAPIEFNKVIVHYRNGSKQVVEMRDHVRAGGETRAIDLQGNNRIIKKVVFYYNSKVKAKRKGVVKLYGRN